MGQENESDRKNLEELNIITDWTILIKMQETGDRTQEHEKITQIKHKEIICLRGKHTVSWWNLRSEDQQNKSEDSKSKRKIN